MFCPPESSAERATPVTGSDSSSHNSPRPDELSTADTDRPREDMVSPAGLEPAACGLGNRRSILLSYGDGHPGEGTG